MALLTIDGVAMPTPSEFSVGIQDLSKAERNANGWLIIERIATKVKLSVKYSFLTAADMATVLKAIAPTSYPVTYIDPSTNTNRTAQFYCGDRSLGYIDFIDGVPRYSDLSFDLIER